MRYYNSNKRYSVLIPLPLTTVAHYKSVHLVPVVRPIYHHGAHNVETAIFIQHWRVIRRWFWQIRAGVKVAPACFKMNKTDAL